MQYLTGLAAMHGSDLVAHNRRSRNQASTNENARDEFSSIISDIGALGPWQGYIALVNTLMTINAAIQNNSYPMLVGNSNNWAYGCKAKNDDNFTLPLDSQTCYVQISPAASAEQILCTESEDHQMVYKHEHFEKALLTEFHLLCGYSNFLIPLVHSAFTIGCFFGVFLFGWLADWIGRKSSLVLGSPLMIILGFALTLSPNIYVFLTIRLFQGVVFFGVFTVAYVLAMETTAPSKRAMIGNVVHIPWGVQFVTVSLVAMWLHNWRYQQIVYSIPTILCLIMTPFLPESPRWLAINGKLDRATQVLMQGAKWNRKEVSEQSIRDRLDSFCKCSHNDSEPKESNFKLALGLIRTPEMRRRFLFSAVIWFQAAFVNHGVNFYAPTLAANPFVAYCLVGCFETFSPLAGAFVFTYGRRVPLVILFIICGLFSFNIITVFKIWPDDHEYQLLAMLLIATFLSDMAFNGIYVHVSEFMPTTHRSIGLGSCSSVARIGSSLSSVLVETAGSYPYLPPVVFGAISFAGSFCTYMLPSTENQELPETIEDVEISGRERREGGLTSWMSSGSLGQGGKKKHSPNSGTDHVPSVGSLCDARIKKNTVATGFCEEAMIHNVTCV